MPDLPKSTCAHCGGDIVFAPDYLDESGEADPNKWRHLQQDGIGATACATKPDRWESDEWPKASPNKWIKRITARVDFADGTSSEVTAEEPTDYQWSVDGEPTRVFEQNGSDWVGRDVLCKTLDLRVAWEEKIEEVSEDA